jgi:hypothetical protein
MIEKKFDARTKRKDYQISLKDLPKRSSLAEPPKDLIEFIEQLDAWRYLSSRSKYYLS